MKNVRDWELLYENWLNSGLSQADYCKRNNIAKTTFSNNIKKYKKQNQTASHFIELSNKEEVNIEIKLNNGIVISLPQNVSTSRASELVKCLS